MINLNLVQLSYVFFRLAPFIIVCSFLLQSIFNTDLKGFVFLLGLVFTIGICSILPASVFEDALPPGSGSKQDICRIFDLGFISFTSGIPLSFVIYGFTFTFLTTIIVKYKLQKLNWPTFIFFPIMIVLDAWWNLTKDCANMKHLAAGYLTSCLFGGLYAYGLIQSNLLDFQIWNGISSNEMCKRPSRAYYKCTSMRNKNKPISVKRTNTL
jgi:hypothetical protein